MNDGRTCINYCNFFSSCFSVTSNKLYFAWFYSNIYSMKKILIKQKHIMVRLSPANSLRFHFFPTAPKGDEVTAIFVKLQGPTIPVQKITGSQRTRLSYTKG